MKKAAAKTKAKAHAAEAAPAEKTVEDVAKANK